MSRNNNISVYRGIAPDVITVATWQQAVEAIASEKYRSAVEALRKIEDKEKYRKEKCSLIALTFGGTFNGRRHRDAVVSAAGFIVADIDHIEDVKKTFDDLTRDEHVWFAFISPGGDGIKVGLRSETVNTDADHKLFYGAVESYFQEVYNIKIDKACKDINRLTFVSWDPGAHINENASYFDHSDFEFPAAPTPKPKPKTDISPAKQKYGDKVLAGACKKIEESAPGEQHHIRVAQATNVGGYTTTGYIDRGHAVIALERAVISSGAKNLKQAMQDIEDGLKYGEAKPLDPVSVVKIDAPPLPEPPPAGKEDLPWMVGEARPIEKTEEDEERAAMQNEPKLKKPAFEFIHNADILANLKPVEWQIQDVLCANSFYYDFGDPGSYKTFIALDRLLCIAAGIDYHGHKVKQGSVFYVAGEGAQGIGRRIAAWHIQHKTKAKDIPFFMAKTPTQLMDLNAVDEVRKAVDVLAKEYGPPSVIHLDTLSRNFGEGDENATKDMNRVIQNIDLAFGNDFCRGITHHTGHANKERARGSIALDGAADTAYRVATAGPEQVFVECKKMKDAPKAQPILFDLETVKLIIGSTYDQSFTVSMAQEGAAARDEANSVPTDTVKASAKMKSATRLLERMYDRYVMNLSESGRPEKPPNIEFSAWRMECVDAGLYTRTAHFNRAAESMKERRLVGFYENGRFVYPFSRPFKPKQKENEINENGSI